MKKALDILMGKEVKIEKPIEEKKPFVPNKRKGGEDMTEEEKLKQGFNGSTYSINGRDIDF